MASVPLESWKHSSRTNIVYKLVAVGGYMDISREIRGCSEQVRPAPVCVRVLGSRRQPIIPCARLRTAVLVNCGATSKLDALLDLSDERPQVRVLVLLSRSPLFEPLLSRLQLCVFVVDSHHPVHHSNIRALQSRVRYGGRGLAGS